MTFTLGSLPIPEDAATGMRGIIRMLEDAASLHVPDDYLYAGSNARKGYKVSYGDLREAIRILKEKFGEQQ